MSFETMAQYGRIRPQVGGQQYATVTVSLSQDSSTQRAGVWKQMCFSKSRLFVDELYAADELNGTVPALTCINDILTLHLAG
jgi:hypothetical protein